MLTVNMLTAKTNLSRLVEQVESGVEPEIIIARNGKPAVKLALVTPPVRKSRKHLRGSGIGKLWMADDAFSPETDLEIQKLFEADDPLLTLKPGPAPSRKKKSA